VASAKLAPAFTRFTTDIASRPATMSPAPRRAATPTWISIMAGKAGSTMAR
jgi:hypothetical protein